jgi:hypothetical protein
MATVNDFQLSATPTLIASGVGEVHVKNVTGNTGDLILGDSSVSTSTGFSRSLSPGATASFHLGSTDELWAVTVGVGAPTQFMAIRVLHTR